MILTLTLDIYGGVWRDVARGLVGSWMWSGAGCDGVWRGTGSGSEVWHEVGDGELGG